MNSNRSNLRVYSGKEEISRSLYRFACLVLSVVMLCLAGAAGRASAGDYPPSFDLSNLSGTNGFTVNGAAAEDAASRVAGAGDINGDGIDDFIIGAPYADPGGRAAAGQSYVIFGTAAGFPASLELSSLDGTNGFVINGINAGDQAGYSASKAGDVNNDGIDDLILGAWVAHPQGATMAGQAYVIFGRRQAFPAVVELSLLNGSDGFALNGSAAGETAGIAVAGGGDVSGDGIDDILIGAPGADPNGISSAGVVYVLFGRSQAFPPAMVLSSINGTNGYSITGSVLLDQAGHSVAMAGDTNGDGIGDIIVDSVRNTAPERGYVVFGRRHQGFSDNVDLASLNGANGFALDGIGGASLRVAGAGDMNGDGYDDVLISSWRADNTKGRTCVVFGKGSGYPAIVDMTGLNGTDGFAINGVSAGDSSGSGISGIGDFNGDGLDDILIGAPLAGTAGKGYIVFGSSGGFGATLELSALDGSNGFALNGLAPSGYTGDSAAGAGDINGDGRSDIILGARLASPGGRYRAGQSYVVFGTSPPTIGAIADKVVNAGTATIIPLVIGDAETAPELLLVRGQSSNRTLVPNANLLFGGSGENRLLTVTPVADQSGVSEITVTVSDGLATASTSFTLTVYAPPTISAVAPKSTPEDTVLTVTFTVDDVGTDPSGLVVNAWVSATDNPALLPAGSLVTGVDAGDASGRTRNLAVTPAADQFGTATITLTVTDGDGLQATSSFDLTVTPVNDLPTSNDARITSSEDAIYIFTPADFPFSDVDAGNTLTQVQILSLPSGTLALSGAPVAVNQAVTAADLAAGKLTYTPPPNANGIPYTGFQFRVHDGTVYSAGAYILTVNVVAVNDPPTIDVIADQTTDVAQLSITVPIMVGDIDTDPATLLVSAASASMGLVPQAGLTLQKGAIDPGDPTRISWDLTIAPAAGQWGETTITVTVSDGVLTASTSFVLTVNNTPTGTDVFVTPVSGVTVSFSEVTSGGDTSVVTSTTLPTPPPTPTGFVFLGTFYDIVTTVSYTGPITICLSYIDLGMTPAEENSLQLLHLLSDGQIDVIPEALLSRDTGNNILCGTVTSLSWFGIALDDAPPTFTLNRLKDTLWPPNNKLVKVATVTDVADNTDPEPAVDIQVAVQDIINGKDKDRDDGQENHGKKGKNKHKEDDEKDKHNGKSRDKDDDGNDDRDRHHRSKDWKVKKKGNVWEVWVRAERPGNAAERIYTITATVTDDTGNEAAESHIVRVAHDKGKQHRKDRSR